MEQSNKYISEILRKYIGSRSLREFSELSGVSVSWLNKMVNGISKAKPNVSTLIKFCKVESEDPNITPKDIFYLFEYNDFADAYPNVPSEPENDIDITTTITTSDFIFLKAITKFLEEEEGKVFQKNVKIIYLSQ